MTHTKPPVTIFRFASGAVPPLDARTQRAYEKMFVCEELLNSVVQV